MAEDARRAAGMTVVEGLGRLTCPRCGQERILLYRIADVPSVCLACCLAATEAAESAALSARLDRYLSRSPDATDERHAGHVWPVVGCVGCAVRR